MITLLNKLRKSDDGVSVLELLLYIVIAAALVLAAWFGLNSLLDRGDESAGQQNVSSAYKVLKAQCMEDIASAGALWSTCGNTAALQGYVDGELGTGTVTVTVNTALDTPNPGPIGTLTLSSNGEVASFAAYNTPYTG
jgi:type II secretory pathway component PulJ